VSYEEVHVGDIVVSRERGAPSGPCSVGAFGELSPAFAATYAEALRQAQKLAVGQHVDVWTTYRVRWSDRKPQTFQRLATRRPPA
jgi:hypothetical protein